MAIEDFASKQIEVLTVLEIAFSSVSFVGSCFIIACFLAFQNLRWNLTLSTMSVPKERQGIELQGLDALNCLGNFLGDPQGETTCFLQAISTQYFSTASILWTTVIAFVLFRTVVEHKPDVANLGPHFHLFVWGSALALTVLPALTSSYGHAGVFCWIQHMHTTDQAMRMVAFYLPLWGAILYNCVVYFRVVRMLRFTMRVALGIPERQRNLEMSAVHRLGFYPLILVVVWLVPTINRIQNMMNPDQPIFSLYILHISLSSLQGFLNSLAYGFNTSVRRTLQEEVLAPLGLCIPGNRFAEMEEEEVPGFVEMHEIPATVAEDGMVDVPLEEPS